MRRRLVTRFDAVCANLEILALSASCHISHDTDIVLVRWNRRAQRKMRKAKGLRAHIRRTWGATFVDARAYRERNRTRASRRARSREVEALWGAQPT